jgi:hypothetical protein
MTDTNPPQERGATDPKEERRRQVMAALTRELPDEPEDWVRDDGGRWRLSEAELERREAEYRRYNASRRPPLPVRPLLLERFDEGRGGRELSR